VSFLISFGFFSSLSLPSNLESSLALFNTVFTVLFSFSGNKEIMNSMQGSFADWLKFQGNVAPDSNQAISTGPTLKLSPALTTIARAEMDRMLELPGNAEPVRGDLDDPSIEWRCGKPNYTLANLAYLKGKCSFHEKGSLEILVENAVKTWEMEASHKVNTDQWGTIDHDQYNVQANGAKVFKLKEAALRGNYNVLMDHVDKEVYDAETEDFESSHVLFQTAFKQSFPWEVLKVFAGPPEIVFSWRHWGEFTGEYKDNRGEGQLLEMTGFAMVNVTLDLKITAIKVYYKPEAFIKALRGDSASDNGPSKEAVDDLIKQFTNEISNVNEDQWEITSANCKIFVNGQKLSDPENFFKSSDEFFPWKIEEVYAEKNDIAFKWTHEKSEKESKHGFAIFKLGETKLIDCLKIFFK